MERSGKKESGDGDIERRNHRFQIIFYHAHYITDERTSQREFSFRQPPFFEVALKLTLVQV